MPLRLADLSTWLTGVVPAGTTVVLNRVPDSPDQIVMASVIPGHGGRGLLTDGAFQETCVHVRSRATTDTEAETVALTVDAALLNVSPLQIGATFVRVAYPLGGPPAYFERDVQNRTTYFCDYILEVQR